MTAADRIHVRAPATTANLGSGFDVAGVALDLWNELEVVRDESARPADTHHLGIGAFARMAPVDGWHFEFTYRIPRSSGLGSSASLIALGLVAGAIAAGVEPDAEALLAEGLPLEGHPDNLAATLVGGACLTWEGRIERLADSVPAEAIALRPDEQVATEHSRSLLPISVPHEDAVFSAGRAGLLGAALASGSERLFAAALDDRLHEPYRSVFLAEVRAELPASALGATLSGSGPTVIVWARRGGSDACVAALRRRWPQVEATPLGVSSRGAIPVNVRFADCRYDLLDPPSARTRYLEAHIPGAAFVDLDEDLSDLSIPPEAGGRHPLPGADRFAEAMSRAGIGDDTLVVAYDEGMSGGAARLWWLLRHFGHDWVAVLDRGLQTWLGPLASGEEEIEPATFVPRERQGDTAGADELLERLGEPGLVLLDARQPERWRGESAGLDPVAGRIPGALNTPSTTARLVDLPPEALAADEIVAYCGSGVLACVPLLALHRAGRTDARLYPGSWSEWSRKGLPAEKG